MLFVALEYIDWTLLPGHGKLNDVQWEMVMLKKREDTEMWFLRIKSGMLISEKLM